ncbi:ribosome biogenesis regulatory protein-domain-containing protein, partial [Pisolithus sp. B1]
MDVSNLLAAQASKFRCSQSVTVEKDTPLDVDAGFLTVTDLNPIDEDSYRISQIDRSGWHTSTSRSSIRTPDRIVRRRSFHKLPPPTTQLPRAKPLPKPKPPTKWERFAAAKGIQKKRRDRKVWDEEKQDWVNRWGRDGKNKDTEDQWIHEVKANADVDFDPVQAARDERKSRVAKNERQRLQNLGRAQTAQSEREQRKTELDKTLAATRTSTASM